MTRTRTAPLLIAALAGLAAAFPVPPRPPAPLPARQMERLGRGLAAIHPEEGKVFLSGRLFATAPDGIGFHVYRRSGDAEAVRLTDKPLTQATCLTDTTA